MAGGNRALRLPELWPCLCRRRRAGWPFLQDEVQELRPLDRGAPLRARVDDRARARSFPGSGTLRGGPSSTAFGAGPDPGGTAPSPSRSRRAASALDPVRGGGRRSRRGRATDAPASLRVHADASAGERRTPSAPRERRRGRPPRRARAGAGDGDRRHGDPSSRPLARRRGASSRPARVQARDHAAASAQVDRPVRSPGAGDPPRSRRGDLVPREGQACRSLPRRSWRRRPALPLRRPSSLRLRRRLRRTPPRPPRRPLRPRPTRCRRRHRRRPPRPLPDRTPRRSDPRGNRPCERRRP